LRSGHTTDIDNASASLLECHLCRYSPAEMIRHRQGSCSKPYSSLLRHSKEKTIANHACVVDQNVDAAMIGNDFLYYPVGVFALGHIALQSQSEPLRSPLLLPQGLLAACFAAFVDEANLRPSLASAITIARPIPRLPPVTKAI